MKKKELKAMIELLEAHVGFHEAMSDHFEHALEACESACIYHLDRSEKAFEIIGRLMVESELDG